MARPTHTLGPVRRLTSLARRLLPYAANVLLSAIASVAVIPVLTRASDAHTWAVFAIGQSIGAAGAVVVGVSWPVTGAARIAGAAADERGALFRGSLRTRLPVLAGSGALVWGAAVLQGLRSDDLIWALAASALLCSGMSNAWFFVGERRPLRLLVMETLPRSIGTGAGLALLLSGSSAVAFLLVQLVGWLVPVGISTADILRRSPHATAAVGDWRRDVLGASSSIIATGYVQVPMLIVAALAPSSVAAYAVIDKLMKFSLTAISPVTQFAQGHVPHGEPVLLQHRVRQASVAALLFGGACALALAALGPFVATALTGGVVPLDLSWSAPFGLVFGAITASSVIGLACLPAMNRDADLLRSIVVGAVAGIPLCWAGAIIDGGRGAAWGVAVAECLVLAWQLRAVLLRAPRLRSRTAVSV